MKKQSRYMVKTILHSKSGITALLFMIMTQAAAAQTRAVAVMEPLPNAATVKHIGNPAGSIVFQVQYDNPSGDKFTLTIKDNDDAVLFQDVYTGKKFDKKFQLPEGQADKLKFIIRGARSNHLQTFEVNTHTRVIEEIVVKRVS